MLEAQRKSHKIYLNWLRFLFIFLLTLGVLFRFVNLDHKPYWGDEIDTSRIISGHPHNAFKKIALRGEEMSVEEVLKYHRPRTQTGLIYSSSDAKFKNSPHAQLYNLLARFYMELFGDRVKTPRGASALISLLAFPGIYWLSLELFELPLVAWMAVALVAIAPVQLIYAQEDRSYSLWMVTILFSSWALLRAMRLNSKMSWSVYAVSIGLGLYAHLLSVIIAITHGFYVIVCESFRLSKKFIAYLFASVAGFLLLIPWFLVKGVSTFPGASGGMKIITPLPSLLQSWTLSLSRIFFDLDSSFSYKYSWLYIASIVLTGYSMYWLFCQTQKRSWLFVGSLILVPAFSLAIPDLIFGGNRSATMRYILPCFLGIEIAVAYLLATKITSNSAKLWQRRFWQFVTVALISSGVVSCAFYSQANTWWNKYREYYHNEVATIVNQADRPLVLATWYDMGTLSYSLASDTVLQDIRLRKDISSVGRDFSNVFVYKTKGILDYFLKNHSDYQIEKTYTWKRSTTPINTTQTTLWQLKKREL